MKKYLARHIKLTEMILAKENGVIFLTGGEAFSGSQHSVLSFFWSGQVSSRKTGSYI